MTEERIEWIRTWFVKFDFRGDKLTRELSEELIDHIRFLQMLIHDLQQESTAYERGVEDGTEQGFVKASLMVLEQMENLRKSLKDERNREIVGGIIGVFKSSTVVSKLNHQISQPSV